MESSETLVVKVVPGGVADEPPRLRRASGAPGLGRSPISSRRALSRRRSLRSDSGLGAPASHPSRLSDGRPSRGGDDDDARPQSAASRARRAVVDTIDTAPSQIFLFLILILALFLTDVVALVSAPDVVNEPVGWTMFAVLIVFAAEFFLNCACRDKYLLSFFFWMDLLGTFSIVADVPWLSEGWLPDGAEIGTTLRVSRAAKIGARVTKDWARVARAVDALPVLRVFRLVRARTRDKDIDGASERASGLTRSLGIHRRRPGGANSSTSRIARNLTESMSKNIAVVVLLTILAAPMLLWNDSDTIPAAYHQSLRAVLDVEGRTERLERAVGQAVADGFYDFFRDSERKPVALVFGGGAWNWTAEYPRSRRSSDHLTIQSGDCDDVLDVPPAVHPAEPSSCVRMELDIALVNQWTAFLNIGMVLFVIVELVLVSALLTMVTNRLVVFPLERIFDKIKSNMDKIMGAFGAGGPGEEEENGGNEGGMGAMEAAVEKMTRLVKHVAGSGAQGAHMVNEYVNDANVDEKTRAWLMDMNTNKTPKRGELRPSPSLGASARRASLGGAGTPNKSPNMSRRGSRVNTPARFQGQHSALQGQHSALQGQRRGSRVVTPVRRDSGALAPLGALAPTSLLRSFDEASPPTTRSPSRRSSRESDRGPGSGPNAGADAFAPLDVFGMSDDDDDLSDGDDHIRAGPELRLRQARRRSRVRVQAVASAVEAAAALGVELPSGLDWGLIDTWEFDALALTSEDARAYVLLMFGSLGLLRSEEDAGAYRAKLASVDAETAAAEGFCSVDRAWHFLARVEGGYRDNAYHNFRHAVDVTHTVYRYIVLTEPRTHVTPVEKFSLMIAALSHDLDHPGVNNAFLVNTKDALATVYNDSSVLENSHIARLYNLIDTRQTRQARAQARRRDRERLKRANGHHEHDDDDDDDASGAEEEHPDEANVFELLDDELYREVRKMIIACVLHTDMSHHFKMVSQMEVFYEVHSEGIRANTRRVNRGITVECIYVEPEDRLFVLQVMLHAADISNPVKPLATYGKWAENVLREFFAQGDQERALGMDVSPMMDAAATNAAMSQINFIEFVVAPLYASFVRLFPETSRLVAHLVANRMHYQAVLERELEGTGVPNGGHPPLENAALGMRAGTGKTEEERRAEKAATRARFRALIDKHEFLRTGARDILLASPTFRILISEDQATGASAPLPTALDVFDDDARRAEAKRDKGSHLSATTSRRGFLGGAAAGMRDFVTNGGRRASAHGRRESEA